MAASKSEPAKQVAIDVLREAAKPLHAKEVAKRVLASGRCAGLKGKTPEATISAMLAVGSKPGGPFARIDKGTYTLAASASASAPSTDAVAQPEGGATTRERSAKPSATPARGKEPATRAKRSSTKQQTTERSR